MPVTLSISLLGDRQLVAKLPRFAASLSDWREFWDMVAEFLEARIEQSFATEGRASGAGAWQALSLRYALWKGVHFPGQPILQATGNMRGSLIERWHPQAFRRRTKSRFVFSSRNPLVDIHHRGKGDWLPARPILVLTDTDKKAITTEAKKWVAMKQAQFGLASATSRFLIGRGMGF